MVKIAVYSVLKVEEPYFKKLNKENFDLELNAQPLNEQTVSSAKGNIGVLVDGFCVCNKIVVDKLAEAGVKYLFARTTGVDMIDLQECTKKGIMVANVPAYSPKAIAELSLSVGLDLHRRISSAVTNTEKGNFKLLPEYFVNEIHDSTVGIIGVGHIGKAEADMYHGLGAKVMGYTRSPNDDSYIDYVSLPELLQKSDIVSLHIPYLPGKNDGFIGEKEINQMKDTAILVNTARAPLVDINAVSKALDNNKLGGYGTDVVVNKDGIDLSGKDYGSLKSIPNDQVVKLMTYYPKVLVTPHMGFFTVQAIVNMIIISYKNFAEALTTGHTPNEIEI